MPAKPSGEVKTRVVHSRQKNGDIYVLERQTIYDPIHKRNKVLSTKLISKIPKGTDVAVPTRPKRPDRKKDRKFSCSFRNDKRYPEAYRHDGHHRLCR